MTTAPLLRASGARIEVDGAELCASLSFEANGPRLGLIGDATPLVQVLSGAASVRRGSVDLLGAPLDVATRGGRVGLALANPPLPATWTTSEYLRASARVRGFGFWHARKEAKRTLAQLELGALAKRRLGMLRRSERAAVGVAHACLGAPDVIWLDRPFDGLSDEERESLRTLIERATAGRRLILSCGAPSTLGVESRMLSSMDQVVGIAHGAVAPSGSPVDASELGSRSVVRAARSLAALSAALIERGVRVEREDEAPSDAGRLFVFGASSALIVEAALEAEAPLLELLPGGGEPFAAPNPLGPKGAAT